MVVQVTLKSNAPYFDATLRVVDDLAPLEWSSTTMVGLGRGSANINFEGYSQYQLVELHTAEPSCGPIQ